MKNEAIYCKYCNKLLDEQKGELAYGCLDCHGMTHVPIIKDIQTKLEGLLMAVQTKHIGETRYETAIRYIRIMENANEGASNEVLKEIGDK